MGGHLKFVYKVPNWTMWSQTKAFIAQIIMCKTREQSMTKFNQHNLIFWTSSNYFKAAPHFGSQLHFLLWAKKHLNW
jgi:hypothetical protein